MHNDQWKIIGDQLPTKSPIELKDKSNVVMQFSNNFSECYPSKASLLSSSGRIADLCSEDGILVKFAGDTQTNDLIVNFLWSNRTGGGCCGIC